MQTRFLLEDEIINEYIETRISRPTIPRIVTVYHGSPYKLNKIEATHINHGTRFSKVRSSSFWSMDKDLCIMFGIIRLLKDNKFMDNFLDLIDYKVYVPIEDEEKITKLLIKSKIYLYEKEIPSKYLGRGHHRDLNEYTIDFKIEPDNVIEYNYEDIRKYLLFVVRDRLNYEFYSEIQKKNNTRIKTLDYLIYKNDKEDYKQMKEIEKVQKKKKV